MPCFQIFFIISFIFSNLPKSGILNIVIILIQKGAIIWQTVSRLINPKIAVLSID